MIRDVKKREAGKIGSYEPGKPGRRRLQKVRKTSLICVNL